ncbi:hypothetical protein AQUSIP_15970 [Aquicella siphonis]|uniref:Tim44-like domain-containing protein n=1 Tax=Aquicella siphonis TaxID=254247 RepID=A0A5E4PIL0_9COXI|nr:transporter [Aquicella siphonis]VVC76288.1 hypothetical protein AQUSIP_15970 [Aquicella siphonis]
MMRTFLSILFVCLVTLGLIMHDAEARRFGGGRSFGVSRSASSFTRSSTSPAPAYGQNYSRSQSPYGQSASPMGRWFGPIAGLITGGLLASLFMSNGLGSGILSWLLVGGLMLAVFSFLRKRTQTSPPYQGHADYRAQYARDAASQFMRNSAHAQPAAPVNAYPVGFDAVSFLRDAKVQFMRLQAAYDQKNLSDIREFTTPPVYAEIQMQLQERGNIENKTLVLSLEAELLNVENETQIVAGTEMQTLIASVRFNGMIQENQGEPAAPVQEIWHFKKDIGSSAWLVAGVQQES